MPIYRAPHLAPDARILAVKQFLSALSQDKPVTFDFDLSPKTDGRTVWLGSIDPTDEAFEVLAVGHGIHEMMHVTETDMAVLSEVTDALTLALLNVLEDVRIDSIGSRRHPGYLAYRRELIDALERTGRLRYDADPSALTLGESLACWLHTTLLQEIGCDWARYYADKFERHLNRTPVANHLACLLAPAREALAAESTRRVLAIARRLVELWPDAARGDDASSDRSAGSAGAAPHAFRLPTLVRLASSHCERPGAAGGGYSPDEPARVDAMPWPQSVQDRYQRDDQQRYARLFERQEHRLADLSERFRQALTHPFEDETTVSDAGRALSASFVNALAVGSNKVFATPTNTLKPLADVCLLLDRSGSMGTDRMTLAKVAVAALSRALKSIDGVRTHTAVFPGLNRVPVGIIETPETPLEESLRRIRTVNAYGGTPLAAALQWAVSNVSERDAKRLIVMITDGVFPSDRVNAFESLLRDNAVELALLCIDTRIEGLTSNAETVSDADDIVDALYRLLARSSLAHRL